VFSWRSHFWLPERCKCNVHSPLSFAFGPHLPLRKWYSPASCWRSLYLLVDELAETSAWWSQRERWAWTRTAEPAELGLNNNVKIAPQSWGEEPQSWTGILCGFIPTSNTFRPLVVMWSSVGQLFPQIMKNKCNCACLEHNEMYPRSQSEKSGQMRLHDSIWPVVRVRLLLLSLFIRVHVQLKHKSPFDTLYQCITSANLHL